MTNLITDAAQAEPPEPARPERRSGSRSAAAGGLMAVVDGGLRALGDLRLPGREVTSGALEADLRATLDHLQRSSAPGADGSAASVLAATLRVACAHLSARNLEEARLVLLTVRDALAPREHAPERGRDDRTVARAHAAAKVQGQALDRRVVLEQAVGVVLEHGCASAPRALAALRAHAERHGVRLDDLAREIVEGRLDPSAVTDVAA